MLGSMMLGSRLGKAVRRSIAGGSVFLAAALMSAAPASAQTQTYTGVTPPRLSSAPAPVVVEQGVAVPSLRVASAPATRVASAPVSRLALTGTDVVSLALIGGSFIALGLVITRRGRIRSNS